MALYKALAVCVEFCAAFVVDWYAEESDEVSNEPFCYILVLREKIALDDRVLYPLPHPSHNVVPSLLAKTHPYEP
jgi:hypothetical protein